MREKHSFFSLIMMVIFGIHYLYRKRQYIFP